RLGRAPAELVAAGYEALAPVADAEAGGLGVRRSGGGWACRLCEQPLGDGAEWRDGTLTRTAGASAALAALGIRVRPREQVELTEHLCPSCGSSLDVAVTVAEAV
ncbi:hypothetical protein Q5424_28245, partial [Conexibacter sp. JD483]